MVTVKLRWAFRPEALAAVIVNDETAALVGVPVIVPLFKFKTRPAGKVPTVTAKVTAPTAFCVSTAAA